MAKKDYPTTVFKQPDPFDKEASPYRGAAEDWWENDAGCFGMSSGRFIPKQDEGDVGYSVFGYPKPSIMQPGQIAKLADKEGNESTGNEQDAVTLFSGPGLRGKR